MITEQFSIRFYGPAFERVEARHDFSAHAVAQSLMALVDLTRLTAQTLLERKVEPQVSIRAGEKPGLFLVTANYDETTFTWPESRERPKLWDGLAGLIELAKTGKRLDNLSVSGTDVLVFYRAMVPLFHQEETLSLISRLTQTLDRPAVHGIQLLQDSKTLTLTREHREVLRLNEGIILNEHTTDLILEVISVKLNGEADGWLFSDGVMRFEARLEDKKFLQSIAAGETVLMSGMTINAQIRVRQKQTDRLVTERAIVKVKDVIYRPDKLLPPA